VDWKLFRAKLMEGGGTNTFNQDQRLTDELEQDRRSNRL